MTIDEKFHDEIRKIDVSSHKVSCDYLPWKNRFKTNEAVLQQIKDIESALGNSFGRSDLVALYKGEQKITTKFIAAMIWGYEAPLGSRRDNRGPSRVETMLKSTVAAAAIEAAKVGTEKNILNAYKNLNTTIKFCGPSFVTKHLYFLGKSLNAKDYPLIFDARVAGGLVKLSLHNESCLEFVTIQADKSAYASYLKYVANEAKKIQCDLDQVEYFLFMKGA